LALQIVDDRDAGERGEQSFGVFNGELLFSLDQDAFAVAVADRHAHAGRANLDRFVADDFARFQNHFHFFGGVALVLGAADVWNQVEGDVVSEGFVFVLTAGKLGLRAPFQIAATGQAGAAGGLIGADDHSLYAGCIVQRFDGDDQLSGRAVRAGDYALVV